MELGRMACLGDEEMRGLLSVFGDGSACRLQTGSWSLVCNVETVVTSFFECSIGQVLLLMEATQ